MCKPLRIYVFPTPLAHKCLFSAPALEGNAISAQASGVSPDLWDPLFLSNAACQDQRWTEKNARVSHPIRLQTRARNKNAHNCCYCRASLSEKSKASVSTCFSTCSGTRTARQAGESSSKGAQKHIDPLVQDAYPGAHVCLQLLCLHASPTTPSKGELCAQITVQV